MKRFKFNLEPVLEQRTRIEEEKQQALAARQAELQAAVNELAQMDAKYKRYATTLRDDHASLSTEELRAHYAHLEYLDRKIVMQHARIAGFRSAADRARAELVAASKERKVIEKLKERRLEEHRAAETAQEQRDLDESNARRHRRIA